MKGALSLALTVILAVIFLLVVGLLSIPFLLGAPQAENKQTTEPLYEGNFDYTSYLLDRSPTDLDSYDNCDKIKEAVRKAVLTGRTYLIDEISYGNDLYSQVSNFPLIVGDCLDEELTTVIDSGLEQKVCTFKNAMDGDIIVPYSPYGGASDASGLYFDDCVYEPKVKIYFVDNENPELAAFIGDIISFFKKDDFFIYLGPSNDLTPSTVKMFYSPDYLYIKEGDYAHDTDLQNDAVFGNAYIGPGRMKFYIGNATTVDGVCNYNIFFCHRPAIAESTDDATIRIFDIFRNLELYTLFKVPYYIRDLTHRAEGMPSYEHQVLYWNDYDVHLVEPYHIETIINAVKSGLYKNVNRKGYYWAHSHWDISEDSISSSGGCWSDDYNDLIESADRYDRTRSIRFNCGSDNICSGDLKIRIAIRQDNTRAIDPEDKEEYAFNFVSGVISFCGD